MGFASVPNIGSSYSSRKGAFFSSALLLQSRTMLEKKDFVATGDLVHIEGDIIVVEIAQHPYFHLGDAIKFTIYSPVGVLAFHSTVVAKNENTVMLINPPEIQRKFEDKRMNPRISVEMEGMVHSINGKEADVEGRRSISCQIRNLSLGGLGFLSAKLDGLDVNASVGMEMDLSFPLVFRAEVVRMKPTPLGLYCGAKFIDISNQDLNSLRAFILKAQVTAISARKKVEQAQ